MLGEMRHVHYKGCVYLGVTINRNGTTRCVRTGNVGFPKKDDDGVVYSYHPTFSKGRLPTEKIVSETFKDIE